MHTCMQVYIHTDICIRVYPCVLMFLNLGPLELYVKSVYVCVCALHTHTHTHICIYMYFFKVKRIRTLYLGQVSDITPEESNENDSNSQESTASPATGDISILRAYCLNNSSVFPLAF